MKLNYDIEKLSNWHYDKYAKPTNELRFIENMEIGDTSLMIVEDLLYSYASNGGIKRIHSGDPALDIVSDDINNRCAQMRKVGYDENQYFIEFHDKFKTLNDKLKSRYEISHEHNCAIIVQPGQCMPVHGDTYSYLKSYMSRDYSYVKYDIAKNAVRYLIFLTEWEWGQSFGAGNVMKWQWKIGDVYRWDNGLLHWMSNASFTPILFFEITGLIL